MIPKVVPFDTYKCYLSLKNHFTKDSYDYHKYCGKSRATIQSFYKRKDRMWFEKISRQKTDQEILDFFVANFVLMEYGSGAVMAVPGHDQRDFEFATKYGLPIQSVFVADGTEDAPLTEPFVPMKSERVNYVRGFAGAALQTGEEAIAAAIAHCEANGVGRGVTNYRLRDWGISRQRYWGTPIPIIHCDEHGAVPVPEQDLPVVLPEDLLPDGSGSPLAKYEPFLKCTCPKCDKPARRESDATMACERP